MNKEINYKSLTGDGVVDLKKLHEIVDRYYTYEIPSYNGNAIIDNRAWKSDFKHTKKRRR
jgi:hypothetical protein